MNAEMNDNLTFCECAFFDLNLTWHTEDPDFSTCFQRTALVWFSSVTLLLSSPIQVWRYWNVNFKKQISPSCLFISKLITTVLLFVVCACDISYSVYQQIQEEQVPLVNYISPAVLCFSFIYVGYLLYFNRNHGLHTSGCLFIFWLLSSVTGCVIFRSKCKELITEDHGVEKDIFRASTFFVFFFLILVQLVLSSFAEKTLVTEESKTTHKICPESLSSFLSQCIYWWFNSLIIQGYRKPLSKDDVWMLNPRDRSRNVEATFDRYMDKELLKIKRKCSSKLRENDTQEQTKRAVDPQNIELETKDLHGDINVEVKGMEENQKKYEPALATCLIKAFGGICFTAALFKLVHDILLFVSPFLLLKVIHFIQDRSEYLWRGYLYAVALFVASTLQSLILQSYFTQTSILGMRLKTAIIASVYKKALRLSNAARRNATVGEIVNLMSVDAQRFMDLMIYFNIIWSGPLQICGALFFLWQILGPSIMAGVGFLVLLIPLNAFLASKQKTYQVEQMNLKDKRIKLMNEVLNGIKVLKLYAWESSFEKKILDIRSKELILLKKAAYLKATSTFTWICAGSFVSLITFGVYVMSSDENILNAEKAFVSLSLFDILKFPLTMFPNILSQVVQAIVSLKRLKKFFSNDELDTDCVTYIDTSEYAVEIDGGYFSWEKDLILKKIDLRITEGSLVAVVGAVGCGKSSLLSALLGEMKKRKGSINIKGSISYVSQLAWIQNNTLRNNVLFGKEVNTDAYQSTIDACALGPDIDILPAGDQTEIGEKGINLSGGQKQRVALARAVYQDTDIYLLDDTLSAVDSHVGKHIFERVLGKNGLLNKKTRIWVTHGLTFLPQVDLIVVLKDGEISELGSFSTLMNHNGAFAEFVKEHLTEELEENIVENDEDLSLQEQLISCIQNVAGDCEELQRKLHQGESQVRTSSGMSEKSLNSPLHPPRKGLVVNGSNKNTYSKTYQHKVSDDVEDLTKKTLEENQKSAEKGRKTEKLTKEEEMRTGNVKLSVFMAYVRSIGCLLCLSILLFAALHHSCTLFSNVWLSEWSNDALEPNATSSTDKRDLRLGIYGLFGFLQGVFLLASSCLLFYGNILAGRRLHRNLLRNVLRSPMSFFDSTPLGRLTNRFSKDMDTIDILLPSNVSMWIMCLFRVLSVPIVIAYSTPLFLAVGVPIAIFYVAVQRFYIPASRQLKRLESVSRSPIYSHFGETITGVSTIRAFNQENRFIQQSAEKVDENHIFYYPTIIANRWLAIRLELAGNLIVFFAALFAVLGSDTLSPGLVGLSITYALSVTQTLNWMVRMTSELETNVVCVERVKEYSETPTEAAWNLENNFTKNGWPQHGKVEFINYGTRYREGLDLVLRNVNFVIQPKEKVGIVGRTGAGKSSLTVALFRIIEAAEGRIVIDGVDISKIGLHNLRSKLTIIPQDPVLFAGTLRTNLDPFETYSDDELWKALDHVHLKTYINSRGEGLDYECGEGGEGLSVGQRQLLCLARALLRKTKLLILDEATAAIDQETDARIQDTIRTEFKDCTVLTIAHRLNTVMDYTRIMVLDQGNIIEFDTPSKLLQDTDSTFYSLAKDAGLV